MNWTIIIAETIVMTIAFTAMILIPLVKNPVWWNAAYHQKRYHFVQSLWGMLIGLIPCLIGAGIYAYIV